jgi:hypothetical protein
MLSALGFVVWWPVEASAVAGAATVAAAAAAKVIVLTDYS